MKNISFMGAVYSDVPAVTFPDAGGGVARFDDASITTATASDVLQGKLFLSADGTITEGTNSGGGGNDFAVTIDWDDTQQMYVPDRTFAEIQSAYEAGEKIAVTMADNFIKDQYIADGYYMPSIDGLIPIPARFSYMVMYTTFPINTILYYMMNENELYYDGESNFYNTMDATATPADVASGKVFFNADGQQTGTGSLVTVSPLSVTQNGTYTAPSGTAYSPVTVNVSGGGGESNYVHGEFNTGSTAGEVITINIPYSGSGYPIAAMVYVKGGVYDSSNTDWYTAVQRYAVGEWVMTKAIQDTAPTYATSNNTNQGVTVSIYKNSSSSANNYSRNSAMNTNSYTSSDATSAPQTCVRFKSATRMSVYVASTSYGLMADLDYEYHIIYSS